MLHMCSLTRPAEGLVAEGTYTRANSIMGGANDRDALLAALIDVDKTTARRIVNEISETNAILAISSLAASRGRNGDRLHGLGRV